MYTKTKPTLGINRVVCCTATGMFHVPLHLVPVPPGREVVCQTEDLSLPLSATEPHLLL